MKKILLGISAILFISGTLSAQVNRCSTMEHEAFVKASDPNYELNRQQIEQIIHQQMLANPNMKTTGGIIIPVVFHILYNTAAENISLAKITAQMNVLNADFSATNSDITSVPNAFQPMIGNSGIQFCFAQRDQYGNPTDGIIRKPTTNTSFSTNNGIKFNSSGGDNAWPRDQYLNIWVGDLGSQILGYAQFPGGAASTDGVVLHYGTVGGPGALGTSSPYNRGRTATHEIGHWLNLYHINGDGFCGNDSVADTPVQPQLYGGCPSFPTVSASCGNGPNGAMTMNYMDYTNDVCMYMFTAGQGTRMNLGFNAYRAALLNSLGCVPTTIGVNEVVQNGISVYPNPSQGLLTVENVNGTYINTTIKVNNMLGQTIISNNYTEFTGVNYLDISSLSDGIYFVEVNTPVSNRTYRVVLEK